MEKDKINRLIEILNEAKEIIAELEGYATKKEKQAKTIEQILATSIRKFEFSTRSTNVLLGADIDIVEDITKYTKNQILKFHNCGPIAANEIEAKLNAVGIKLAQEEED
ncbi:MULTISPECIES: DNA-directed RNA polymerase subunit alpha C-terminal domain-containing protein [Butyricimonas]|jgi:RNA polymerase, alpha subunit C-terminal domain protein|uniref:DNA-directed RNA polymerase subunit alpha C-terminal domain-containing protein n=1 Tax=Butyricimonas TaxID=574697 RepID=UPI000B393860|nr:MULTISPECIES: DNA-directed RNA polymerase subunit alpha C-terminal domain-containing protein [Butyricimonas]OUN64908.1 hypothetical protein B5G13_09765 [Butyricimonas sp. An62]